MSCPVGNLLKYRSINIYMFYLWMLSMKLAKLVTSETLVVMIRVTSGSPLGRVWLVVVVTFYFIGCCCVYSVSFVCHSCVVSIRYHYIPLSIKFDERRESIGRNSKSYKIRNVENLKNINTMYKSLHGELLVRPPWSPHDSAWTGRGGWWWRRLCRGCRRGINRWLRSRQWRIIMGAR